MGTFDNEHTEGGRDADQFRKSDVLLLGRRLFDAAQVSNFSDASYR